MECNLNQNDELSSYKLYGTFVAASRKNLYDECIAGGEWYG